MPGSANPRWWGAIRRGGGGAPTRPRRPMESHCFTKLETHAKIELTWSLSVPRGLPPRLDRAALRGSCTPAPSQYFPLYLHPQHTERQIDKLGKERPAPTIKLRVRCGPVPTGSSLRAPGVQLRGNGNRSRRVHRGGKQRRTGATTKRTVPNDGGECPPSFWTLPTRALSNPRVRRCQTGGNPAPPESIAGWDGD